MSGRSGAEGKRASALTSAFYLHEMWGQSFLFSSLIREERRSAPTLSSDRNPSISRLDRKNALTRNSQAAPGSSTLTRDL